jgi:hypothetical protein
VVEAHSTLRSFTEVHTQKQDAATDTFTDIKAVETTLARLNTLRAPIAHCSMLVEDER